MTPNRKAAQALGLALTLGLGLAGAQTSGADLLSRLSPDERALLSVAGLTPDIQLRPGVVAPGLPFQLPPLAGRVVVGSVTQTALQTVVVRTSLPPETAQNVAVGLLKKSGWIDLYPQTQPREVFQSSRTGQGFFPLCKPGMAGQLMVTSLASSTDPARPSTQLIYRFSTFPQASQECPANQTWSDPKRRNFYAPQDQVGHVDPLKALLDNGLKLPSLPAPADSAVETSGSMYSPYDYATYVMVYTPLSAEGLRQHYAAALKAQGWTQTGTTTLNAERVTQFKAKQGSTERLATLSLIPRPELGRTEGGRTRARYDVQLQLR